MSNHRSSRGTSQRPRRKRIKGRFNARPKLYEPRFQRRPLRAGTAEPALTPLCGLEWGELGACAWGLVEGGERLGVVSVKSYRGASSLRGCSSQMSCNHGCEGTNLSYTRYSHVIFYFLIWLTIVYHYHGPNPTSIKSRNPRSEAGVKLHREPFGGHHSGY